MGGGSSQAEQAGPRAAGDPDSAGVSASPQRRQQQDLQSIKEPGEPVPPQAQADRAVGDRAERHASATTASGSTAGRQGSKHRASSRDSRGARRRQRSSSTGRASRSCSTDSLVSDGGGVEHEKAAGKSRLPSSLPSLPTWPVATAGSDVDAVLQRLSSAVRDWPEVHHTFICDGCRAYPVIGPLRLCSQCTGFGLCSACYQASDHESSHGHDMLRSRVPFLPQHLAAALGDVQALKVLHAAGFDMEATMYPALEALPIHFAALAGHTDAVSWLVLHAGQDPLVEEGSMSSPVSLAALGGHIDTLQCLLRLPSSLHVRSFAVLDVVSDTIPDNRAQVIDMILSTPRLRTTLEMLLRGCAVHDAPNTLRILLQRYPDAAERARAIRSNNLSTELSLADEALLAGSTRTLRILAGDLAVPLAPGFPVPGLPRRMLEDVLTFGPSALQYAMTQHRVVLTEPAELFAPEQMLFWSRGDLPTLRWIHDRWPQQLQGVLAALQPPSMQFLSAAARHTDLLSWLFQRDLLQLPLPSMIAAASCSGAVSAMQLIYDKLGSEQAPMEPESVRQLFVQAAAFPLALDWVLDTAKLTVTMLPPDVVATMLVDMIDSALNPHRHGSQRWRGTTRPLRHLLRRIDPLGRLGDLSHVQSHEYLARMLALNMREKPLPLLGFLFRRIIDHVPNLEASVARKFCTDVMVYNGTTRTELQALRYLFHDRNWVGRFPLRQLACSAEPDGLVHPGYCAASDTVLRLLAPCVTDLTLHMPDPMVLHLNQFMYLPPGMHMPLAPGKQQVVALPPALALMSSVTSVSLVTAPVMLMGLPPAPSVDFDALASLPALRSLEFRFLPEDPLPLKLFANRQLSLRVVPNAVFPARAGGSAEPAPHVAIPSLSSVCVQVLHRRLDLTHAHAGAWGRIPRDIEERLSRAPDYQCDLCRQPGVLADAAVSMPALLRSVAQVVCCVTDQDAPHAATCMFPWLSLLHQDISGNEHFDVLVVRLRVHAACFLAQATRMRFLRDSLPRRGAAEHQDA